MKKSTRYVIGGLAAMLMLPVLYASSFVYGADKEGSDVWRVNRFTGRKEYSTEYGWLTMKQLQDRIGDELEAKKVRFARLLDEVSQAAAKGQVRYATWDGTHLSVALQSGEQLKGECPPLMNYGGDVVTQRLQRYGVPLRDPDPLQTY